MTKNSLNRKKIIALIVLIIMLTILLFACKDTKQTEKLNDSEILLYYLNDSEDDFVTEKYELQGETIEEKTRNTLLALAKEPTKNNAKTVLDPNILISSTTMSQDILKIDFYTGYVLDMADELMARVCIVKSLAQIEGISYVEFYVNGQTARDYYGKMLNTIYLNNYTVASDSMEKIIRNTEVNVFFANATGDKLLQQKIQIEYPLSMRIEEALVRLLIDGPLTEDTYRTINKKTVINSINLKNSICYIDLSEDFLNMDKDITEEVAVYSLVNTLVENNSCNRVMITIEGKQHNIYKDKLVISEPLKRNLDIIDAINK